MLELLDLLKELLVFLCAPARVLDRWGFDDRLLGFLGLRSPGRWNLYGWWSRV